MLAEKTGKLPKALENEPQLFDDMRPIWDAFWRLNRSRAMGWSVGPIPLTEIEAYVRLFRVRHVDRFIDAIDSLDRAYLEHRQKESKNSNSTTPRAPRTARQPVKQHHGPRRA